MQLQLVKLKCLRCGHKWRPRKPVVRVCPKCKSPYWDTPRGGKGVEVLPGAIFPQERNR